ncbi:hypothetical protein BGZ82_002267 [Podila clonocystis]|nr:hypothetical protein BGZ82_002267 [Podila clonocystis]
MPSAQDSSAYEDEPNSPQVRRSPSPSEDDRAERRKSPSDSSSFDSSSSDDDAEDEPEFRPSKNTTRHEDESPYDSFEEVDGSDNSQPSKAPRTSRTEFRNVDAELYDLRRSGRARRAPKIFDDDEDESEVEESDFENDDASDSGSDNSDDDSGSDFGYGSKKKSPRGSKKLSRSSSSRKDKLPKERTIQRITPQHTPSSESDSDGDWGGSKKKSGSKRRRRIKHSNNDADQGVRYSSRGGQVNYNEDENDWGLSSEDDDKLPMYTKPAIVEDEGDVIESVHDFRRIENTDEDDDDSDDPRGNMEYLIKWKQHSHMHNTWEAYDQLRQYKGFKKVDSYIQRFVYPEIALKSDPNTMREEIEQSDVNREMLRDELKDYRTVERIIASRTSKSGETEYFCKWNRLPYSAATWEVEDQIADNHQTEIDAFLDRESSQKVPYRTTIYPKGQRPPFKKMTTQPEYLVGGDLRDYQLTGLNWMSNLWSKNENGILADEMGLGKTVQSISIISFLFHTHHLYGPYLVVVPLSTIGAWQREFERWAPDMNLIVYIGDGASRQTIRDYEFYQKGSTTKIRFNVLLTTFELVRMDRAELDKIKWTYLAIDEAHRLKNKQSQLHETLKDFHTANRLLITGTPLQNSVKELIALCNFLNPEKFDDDDFDIDMGDNEQESKIQDLHSQLKPYMLRRLKKDVEKSLPKKTERILRVELSQLQTHYYKNILTKNFAVLNKGISGQGQLSLLNVAMELKKASNHPYLFPNAEVVSDRRDEQLKGIIMSSGKMVLLDKLLTRLKKDGHRVLIFSQMVRMLDIMTDYMALRGFAFQRLDGSVGSEARKRSIEHFNAPNSIDFAFLLSTRAGGLGINLETADTVIIFDSDWNPQNDLQAMARAHRIGQKNVVNVYRFVSKDTIEEDIIERAKRKMVLEYCIIKQMDTSGLEILQQKKAAETSTGFSKEELTAILKFGAQSMFQQTEGAANKKLDELDLDEILARAEDHDTSDAVNLAGGDEFLSQFQFADFGGTGDMSWDDIIPAEEREQYEAEERAKLEEQLYTPRNRGRVSYAEGKANSPSPESEGRRRKRKAAGASSSVTPGPKKKRGAGLDPSELNTKDLRALARGMLKFGTVFDRYQDVVAEAELEDKEEDVVKMEAEELVHACEDALGVAHDSIDNQDDDEDLPYAKKNAKAVLFTYKEVEKVNAGQMVLRLKDLRAMNRRLDGTDITKFRLNVALKPVLNWSCSWGQKEDAMLVVGIYKHGFGAWDKIQEDSGLGFTKKFFLSTQDAKDLKKIPKALHLVRRGEYLLKVLRESERDKKTRQSNASASSSRRVPGKGGNASSNSNHGRDKEKSSSKSKSASNSTSKSRSSKPRTSKSSRGDGLGSDQDDEFADGQTDEKSKSMLRAVGRDIRTIRESDKKPVDPQVIAKCLAKIGREIEELVESSSSRSRSERDRLSRQLWTYAGKAFPTGAIHYSQLRDGYLELKKQESSGSSSRNRHASEDDRKSSHRRSSPSSSRRDYSRERDDPNGGRHRSRSGRDGSASPRRSSTSRKRSRDRTSHSRARRSDSVEDERPRYKDHRSSSSHDRGSSSRHRNRSDDEDEEGHSRPSKRRSTGDGLREGHANSNGSLPNGNHEERSKDKEARKRDRSYDRSGRHKESRDRSRSRERSGRGRDRERDRSRERSRDRSQSRDHDSRRYR